MQDVLKSLKENVKVHGGHRFEVELKEFYVMAIVEVSKIEDEMLAETFAPTLYQKVFDLKDAISMQNNVKQGLSSSIFTNDIRESELFLSSEGSDCGIANVNIGTSGAEIGGALVAKKILVEAENQAQTLEGLYEKSHSNCNHSELPLAQGVEFDES